MSAISYTLSDLAKKLEGEFSGPPDLVVTGVSTLEKAGEGDLSFLANPKYANSLKKTRAAVVVVGAENKDVGDCAKLIVKNPYLVFARAVSLFHPPMHPSKGVSQNAFVSIEAKLGDNVTIMSGTTIESGVSIGANTVIYPGVYVGKGVEIGQNCVIHPNVTVREGCKIGDRVVLQPGCVIGSDGFGYAMGPKGHEKFPQIGIVVIENDVEVGACTTIDRAALGMTRICEGSKIDNLVQIAHNVVIGKHSVIVSQVGISGSAKIGNGVVLGGQTGVAGHIEIGDGAQIGAKSGVTGNVKPGAKLAGHPIMDLRDWLKAQAHIKQLSEMQKKIKILEKKLAKLTGEDPEDSLEK